MSFKRKIILAVMIAASIIWANRVSPQTAENLAINFVETELGEQARENIRLRHTARRTTERRLDGRFPRSQDSAQDDEEITLLYVFNINEATDGGFVIISGDDAARPILGFSQNGNFDENNLPPNFRFWLDFLKSEIAFAQENDIEQSEEIREEWDSFLQGSTQPIFSNTVLPLIRQKWDQRAPFNDSTPLDGSQRSITGCVATAMAQIMAFHQHPARGTGQSQAYRTRTRGINVPAVNFNVAYRWNDMRDVYTNQFGQIAAGITATQRSAVAQLMRHAGVSVQMDFSAAESGAFSGDVPLALVNHFGYDRGIQRRRREHFDNISWEAMLREQIMLGLPVYYDGSDSAGNSGHAFILDGFNNNGQFHFNWGWGGSHDGWFVSTALNPGTGGAGAGAGNFSFNQGVIINIMPDDGGTSNYEFAVSGLSVNKTSVSHYEQFLVSVEELLAMSALDTFTGGQMNVALTNEQDEIVAVIGSNMIMDGQTFSLNIAFPMAYGHFFSNFSISANVPSFVSAGQYRLRLVIRPTVGEWQIVNLGNPSFINFEVSANDGGDGGYEFELSGFRTNKTSVYPNEQFTVSIDTMRLISMWHEFPGGHWNAAIINEHDEIITTLGQNRGINRVEYRWFFRELSINCVVPSTVPAGNYELAIITRPTNGDWRIVRFGNPSFIAFEVLGENTSIRNNRLHDSRYGILLESAIVSDLARISVIIPEPAQINLRIMDNLGNVVFSADGVGAGVARPENRTNGDLGGQTPPLHNAIVWNLTNLAGRFVANGTYLIIVEATGISGRRFTYSSRIGVNR
ncbi:MAG: C10 family peptidase [Chitinivibrionia bacterium]|nr:C10 family peptidase [Chitinivibrionia bacterium]